MSPLSYAIDRNYEVTKFGGLMFYRPTGISAYEHISYRFRERDVLFLVDDHTRFLRNVATFDEFHFK